MIDGTTYLGDINTNTGSWSEDIKARVGRDKKATMELDTIGKDRGIRKELKMKLVKALKFFYGHYIRSRRMDFKRKTTKRKGKGKGSFYIEQYLDRSNRFTRRGPTRLEAAEMWCYRRMLRLSWTEKRTNKSILDELQTRRELLVHIFKRKMLFFGDAYINNKCNLIKICILGMMPVKRRRGAPGYNDFMYDKYT